ncbi:MAG: hypothetical protein KAR07_08085 [Spirochaetes bacterium]|nr:hypothetical protein [Spirochaetota bacterium]
MTKIEQQLVNTKPAYLDILHTIRRYRLNTIAKKGPILIPKNEINFNDLKRYIFDLQRDGIINIFDDIDLKKLNGLGYKTGKKYLNENIIVKNKNKKTYVILSCNTVEKIDKHLRSLHIPGSSRLIIEHDGKNGCNQQNGETCSFTKNESSLLNFLYSNVNKSQKTEDIMRECKCSREDVKSACYNIRSKLKNKLEYSEEESEKILPKGQHGFYILNIY